MSSLSDFLGGGGGGISGSYTASTAVAGTKLTANKAYPIASDGKIYDIDGGAFARTPFNSFDSTNTEAELGTLARATTGGSTLGASAGLYDAEYINDAVGDYSIKFLPDGITEIDLYIEDQNTGDVYLTLSQNATSFQNVGVLFTNGNNRMGDYKVMNLPEDSTHYYLAIFVVTYSSYSVSPNTNHYVIVSVAKSDFTVTVLETIVNAGSDTIYSGQWNLNGTQQLHRTVNFLSARNGTVFLSTRGTSTYGTKFYNWGTHETGAGRTRAIDSSYNSTSNSVTNLAITGWYNAASAVFQLFKISDADGTFLTFGNTTTNGAIRAQLLTLDASATLTATNLTVSGETTNLTTTERRLGKMLQTSTSNKFVHVTYTSAGSAKATLVTLDTSANTLTFSSTTTTITGFGSESYPSYLQDWFFLHGRDIILTNENHAIDVNPTDFSVNSTARVSVQGEIFNNQTATGTSVDTSLTSFDDYVIHSGSNDYTAVGLAPNPDDPDTVANIYVDYLKVDVPSVLQTNSSIALVLADTEAGATATIELASGDTATTSLDSTKFLTKEGMVYPFTTNIDGVISSPGGGAVKSVQFLSDTAASTSRTVSISEVNTDKSMIIAHGTTSAGSSGYYNFRFTSSTEVSFTVSSSTSATAYFQVIEYV